jgi:gluconokinase
MTYLIVDIGSSSVRALLVDDAAQPIPGAVVTQRIVFETALDGTSEIDAHALREHVESALDSVLQLPAARDIRALGMATFAGNLLGVDASGQPVTPIITYADTRAQKDADLLRESIDAEAARQRTGCPVHAAYHPARLHWLARTQPERFARVDGWLDAATWLYERWFGVRRCSYSIAAWNGLLDAHRLAWDETWLSQLGVRHDQLPALADFSMPCTGLSGDDAARWPALRDVPFFLAIGDGAAANIGMGACDPQTAALTLGTTGAIRIVQQTAEPIAPVPRGLWRYRVDASHLLMGGATSEGGSVRAWIRSLFPTLDLAEAEAAIAQRDADAHGLTFLPLLTGERSPGWQDDASGTLHGLRLSTSPVDVLQAALEGVALRLALVADQLPLRPQRIHAGGGALQSSPLWTQIVCDALHQPLHLIDDEQPTARGVAVMLRQALDGIPWEASPPSTGQVVAPRPSQSARLRAARERQSELYARLYE